MALTPLRWIAGAVAGCLAVSVLILRGDPPRERAADPLWEVRRVLDNHGAHASEAARRLRVVMLLDSLGAARRTAGQATQVGQLRIFRDAALPAQLADSMLALARRAARQLPDSAGTGTDLVFVYDTVSQLRGASIRRLSTQMDYVLPRSAGERCVALAHVGIDALGKRPLASLPTDAAAQRLLGPCAYYQAFGLPGREVDAWLRTRGWTFVGDGSWEQQSPAAMLFEPSMRGAARQIERALFGQTTIPFLFDMRLDAVQCAAGDAAACDHTVLTRATQRVPAMLNGNVVYQSYPAITFTPDWYPRRVFGRREGSLLADMVHTLGRDRFARFWRSDEAVPLAFEHAAGQPLERWATDWARRTYGTVPPRGAGVGLSAALVSLLLVALTLSVALVVSERRQFV